MKKYTIAFAIACSGFVTACQSQPPSYLHMLSPAELNQVLQKQDVILVDVHTPQGQPIQGTDLFIPYDNIQSQLDKLPSDKATPIYLYCESGRMANTAAQTLHDMGYQNLFNLEGGRKAWRQAGFPMQ